MNIYLGHRQHYEIENKQRLCVVSIIENYTRARGVLKHKKTKWKILKTEEI